MRPNRNVAQPPPSGAHPSYASPGPVGRNADFAPPTPIPIESARPYATRRLHVRRRFPSFIRNGQPMMQSRVVPINLGCARRWVATEPHTSFRTSLSTVGESRGSVCSLLSVPAGHSPTTHGVLRSLRLRPNSPVYSRTLSSLCDRARSPFGRTPDRCGEARSNDGMRRRSTGKVRMTMIQARQKARARVD